VTRSEYTMGEAYPFDFSELSENDHDNVVDFLSLEEEEQLRVQADSDAVRAHTAECASHIDDILGAAAVLRASDIHLRAALPPMFRVDGHLVKSQFPYLDPADVERLTYSILNNDQVAGLQLKHELDFSHSSADHGRFRANVYRQRGTLCVAMRAVPYEVPRFENLNLPNIIRDMAEKTSGFIVVTGPTGSGKSTTIASMIDYINETQPVHILTIEDPIEYLHKDKMAMVNQREMHTDTASFSDALRAVLREDPDVILIGEMRDLETISAAITLAETGHLVFGTLHTRSAAQTIDRIVDVFEPHHQGQVRLQLANNLLGVVSQLLVPKVGGGRIAALEILTGTNAIKNLIREGKTHLIPNTMVTSEAQGMQLMDKTLASLAAQHAVSLEDARTRCHDLDSFDRYLKEF